MTKMIEVPEEYLLALKEWRRAHRVGDRIGYITFPVDDLIACLPTPIEVGTRVRTPAGVTARVIAADGGDVWIRYDNGTHATCCIKDLEVIE